MEHIYYKSGAPHPGEYFGRTGTGFCGVIQRCFTPVNLFDVTGTMTISNGRNIITISFENNVARIPILIESSITRTVEVTLQEFETEDDPETTLRLRKFRLSVGELFRTEFETRNGEFRTMHSIRSLNGSTDPNVVEMAIAFRIGGELQLVEPADLFDLRHGGLFSEQFGRHVYDINTNQLL